MTLDDIYADVTGLLLKYMCYCNSSNNLKVVTKTLEEYFNDLRAWSQIQDYSVCCDETFNGGEWGQHPQAITGQAVVRIDDIQAAMFMFHISTRDVEIFPQWKISANQMSTTGSKVGKTGDPQDNYDRAMGIIR